MPVVLSDVAEPALWIGGIVGASLLAFWLTGSSPPAGLVAVAGMVLAASRWVKRLAEMRSAMQTALDRAEKNHDAMEQALRRSQKMAALGSLTVGVAHDFNNHLTVISSNVEMMARRLDSAPDSLLRHTRAAMEGVQRAATLTGRLLSFSRQPEPEPELVDIDRLLGGLADLLRRTVGDRNAVQVAPAPEQWFTWADVNHMEHALLSLAVSARDQLRSGSVLMIEVATLRLGAADYTSVQPGEYIQIEIRDSLNWPRTWEPANDLTSADLSMARAFLRQAGGTLLRSGSADGGLSLRLLLPRYTPPALSPAPPHRKAGARWTTRCWKRPMRWRRSG